MNWQKKNLYNFCSTVIIAKVSCWGYQMGGDYNTHGVDKKIM
jgi:hypothetical protein